MSPHTVPHSTGASLSEVRCAPAAVIPGRPRRGPAGRFAALAAIGAMLAAVAPATDALLPLKVGGTQLVTSNGAPVRLRGVNCAGLEWSSNGDGQILTTVTAAVRDWHANLIRLPLAQDRWFGKADEQQDGGEGYRALVRQIVDVCAAGDAYLILDLHWSNAGEWGRNIGQHNLPDKNSIVFWKDVATAFKDHPAVLFDLYNEPAHINWDQWLNGGPMVETNEKTGVSLRYEAIGMQALVDAIRSTGAKNVIVAGGINWAYELEGIPGQRELKDATGHGVIYAVHPYPHHYDGLGRETVAQVTARMEAFAKQLPMIVLEFGSIEAMWPFPPEWQMTDEKWNREIIAVLESRGWNWAAWDFHTTAWPCLIADWDFTPTPHFGVWVKEALAKNVR